MPVSLTRILISIMVGGSVLAAASLAGLTRNVEPLVDEVFAAARRAPVDYGPGPGRGRPASAAKTRTGRIPYTAAPAGSVTDIWLSDPGSYFVAPTCTLGPPDTATGQQAACGPYAFGISTAPPSMPGSGYKAGDVLTMKPRIGLNCPIYPALSVKSVDAAGGITALQILNPGMCLAFPQGGAFSFSGGTGTGFSPPAGRNGIHWYVQFAKVSGGGAGYTTAPAVTFQSAGTLRAAVGTTTIAGQSGPQAVPAGGPTAGTQGVFGTAIPWPINAIHLALLPDGRILDYGSDEQGQQTGALLYDIWDPVQGTGIDAHLVLPNTTSTDIFCGATSVMWDTGKVMMTGGDLTVNGVRNYANNKTTIFSPATDTVANGVPMHYPRWYPTIVPLPNGDKLVLGGWITRENGSDPVKPAVTPEVYHAGTGWRSLSGVSVTDWYYPRAFVAPSGNVFHVEPSGTMSGITTSGTGAIQTYNGVVPLANSYLPTVMFAPGKLLSIRKASVVVIDINGTQPAVTPTNTLDQLRDDASATLLADGQVLVNGGSTVHNALTGVAYTTQIWNPATGAWTTGATAAKPRLYHSNALLLPDGSVLTAGGGSPGPVINLNAEIYYPAYLYRQDGSGMPAPRPAILDAPSGGIRVGGAFTVTMNSTARVGRVTLVRAGTATHASNFEQRFIDLTTALQQNGQRLALTLPANPNVVLPGYYLLFVFNAAGAPSVARQILVTN